MTLNFFWIRFVALGLLVASLSSPCWSQEQKSPTAIESPTSQHIGLIDQVAASQSEIATLKQKMSTLEKSNESLREDLAVQKELTDLMKKPLQVAIVEFEIASVDQRSAGNRLLIPDGKPFSSGLPNDVRQTFGSFVNCVAFEWLEKPMKKSGEGGYWGYVHVRPDPQNANRIQIFDTAMLANTQPFSVRVIVTYRD
jgi:hypothetical protein